MSAVKNWMSGNFLLLNSHKTDMLGIGHHCNEVSLTVDNWVISQSLTAKNLGIMLDPTVPPLLIRILKNAPRRPFPTPNIAKIRFFSVVADAETLIQTFVSSRLDYCSVLLSGRQHASTRSLQMVQNCAPRILALCLILLYPLF